VKVDNTKLVGEALKRAILAGLEEIGLDCEHIASENAPYDTGRLSASITHAIDADEPAVCVGTNVEYAAYQELGTSRGYKGWNGGKGYLRPAASENADRYRAIMRKHLENA
jgi:phage gpG-like protein